MSKGKRFPPHTHQSTIPLYPRRAGDREGPCLRSDVPSVDPPRRRPAPSACHGPLTGSSQGNAPSEDDRRQETDARGSVSREGVVVERRAQRTERRSWARDEAYHRPAQSAGGGKPLETRPKEAGSARESCRTGFRRKGRRARGETASGRAVGRAPQRQEGPLRWLLDAQPSAHEGGRRGWTHRR